MITKIILRSANCEGLFNLILLSLLSISSLRQSYLPQNNAVKHPQPSSFPYNERPNFTPTYNRRNYSFACFNFTVLDRNKRQKIVGGMTAGISGY